MWSISWRPSSLSRNILYGTQFRLGWAGIRRLCSLPLNCDTKAIIVSSLVERARHLAKVSATANDYNSPSIDHVIETQCPNKAAPEESVCVRTCVCARACVSIIITSSFSKSFHKLRSHNWLSVSLKYVCPSRRNLECPVPTAVLANPHLFVQSCLPVMHSSGACDLSHCQSMSVSETVLLFTNCCLPCSDQIAWQYFSSSGTTLLTEYPRNT